MDNNNNYYYAPAQELPASEKAPIITIKEKFDFTKKDFIFSLIFTVLSIIGVDFIMLHGMNLGFTIVFYLLFIVSTVYLFDVKRKPSVFTCICGVLALASAVTFTLYHDILMNVFMLILIFGLFTVYTCGMSGVFTCNEGSCKIVFDMLSGIFVKPFSNFGGVIKSFFAGFSKKGNAKNTIIGIVIALPVLLVVVPLLVSGDEAFSGLINMIFKNVGIYLLELFVALIIAPYLISYFVVKRKRLDLKSGSRDFQGAVAPSVAISFLSVISVTYVVYLFSQLAYFFSAFSGILPSGYTLTESEFARRGFFEMFAVCVINFIIVTLATVLTKRDQNYKVPLAVKILSAFVILFSMVMLITAMAKMKLNIEIFGLSKNRVFVSVFMLMMLVSIVFYIIHIFYPKFGYMQGIVIICSAMLCALSFCNLDAQIAKYNVEKYLSGDLESVDVSYLYSLSDSAYPYILELDGADDHLVAKEVKRYAAKIIREDYDTYLHQTLIDNYTAEINASPSEDFREYNKAKADAVKLFADYYNSLDEEGRKNLIDQYKLDEGYDYTYDEIEDTYYKWENNYCSKYQYVEKNDRYEYMGTVDNYDDLDIDVGMVEYE